MPTPLIKLGLTTPEGFSEVVREMNAFEDGDPTRLRYPTGARKAYKNRSSFPEKVTAPVGRWQQRIEAILARHFAVRADYWEREDKSLLEELGIWYEVLEHDASAAGR